jgi:hypothetical protein
LPHVTFKRVYPTLRVSIFNYLGQTQEELINLTLVSNKVNTDCKSSSIEWKIIPTIEISPTKVGSSRALLLQLKHHLLDNDTNKKLRRNRHMKVNDVNKFDDLIEHEVRDIIKDVRMDWILSLDMSSLIPTRINKLSLLYALSDILQNLCEINLSNIGDVDGVDSVGDNMYYFSMRCPHLEKVTWNNNSDFYSNGYNMKFHKNLKEIIMDDSVFLLCVLQKENMSNLDNHRDEFILHRCSKVLERVSIRNAKWYTSIRNNTRKNNINEVIPQSLLIKFVRNGPTSLRWFRSDLTQDNMTMLRLERPEIESLN